MGAGSATGQPFLTEPAALTHGSIVEATINMERLRQSREVLDIEPESPDALRIADSYRLI